MRPWQLKLNALVDELLLSHGGGEGYFSTLDARLQQLHNRDIVVELFRRVRGHVAVTGSFGHYVRDLRAAGLITITGELLHFTGNLRRGSEPQLLWSSSSIASNSLVTFVDDSFYSGKTLRAVQRGLYSLRLYDTRAVVVYDGSRDAPLDNWFNPQRVDALYRYYDRR